MPISAQVTEMPFSPGKTRVRHDFCPDFPLFSLLSALVSLSTPLSSVTSIDRGQVEGSCQQLGVSTEAPPFGDEREEEWWRCRASLLSPSHQTTPPPLLHWGALMARFDSYYRLCWLAEPDPTSSEQLETGVRWRRLYFVFRYGGFSIRFRKIVFFLDSWLHFDAESGLIQFCGYGLPKSYGNKTLPQIYFTSRAILRETQQFKIVIWV